MIEYFPWESSNFIHHPRMFQLTLAGSALVCSTISWIRLFKQNTNQNNFNQNNSNKNDSNKNKPDKNKPNQGGPIMAMASESEFSPGPDGQAGKDALAGQDFSTLQSNPRAEKRGEEGERESWRIFIAVPISDAVKGRMADWCAAHRDSLIFQKWVHAGDYHITVQFLGDTPASKAWEAEQALSKELAGFPPFTLALSGIGAFGRAEQPRVLWAGIEGEMDRLRELHEHVVSAMLSLGFTPEERPYHPHVTLARKHGEGAAFDASAAGPPPDFGEFEVGGIAIYRTLLGRKPMYEPVAQILF